MAESRVVPSGKVYRQMFDAQVHLSLSVHETRRRRFANEGFFSGDDPVSRDTDSGTYQLIGDNQLQDTTIREKQFSSIRPKICEDWADYEEIQGLPDNVVSAKTGSDITERLKEKKQRDHIEVVAHLQRDLSVLSARYEPLFRQTGEDFFLRLSECYEKLQSFMQKTENVADLKAFSYEDMHTFKNTISQQSALKRKWIKELDETFVKYEAERASMISALLKKYAAKLEKISYIMPCDVHRLIDNEAMMINQALLANRRAIAKLHLNLMENDLQIEALNQQKCEAILQDWKTLNVLTVVNQFKEFMNSPEIQAPKNVQDTIHTMRTTQEMYNEQRVKILQQIRTMIPPRCTKEVVAEWYSTLTSINGQIDCMNIDTITKMRQHYENTWQKCLAEIEHLKNEVSAYGNTPAETQKIINAELLPVIGKCQKQAEEHLAAVDKAFENLAKTSAHMSKSLFKFMRGVAHLWEVHSASLLKREQELQNHLEKISYSYDQENQKKEAHLDVLMDKLRQESTEEALKSSLEKTLAFLEEIKEGYVAIYKEEVDAVENYPAIVLEELHAYSSAVSRYFSVKEVYSQDLKELQMLYPSLKLADASGMASVKGKRMLVNPRRRRCPDVSQKANPQEHCSLDSLHSEGLDHPQEFLDPHTSETFTTANGNVFHCYGFIIPCDNETDINFEEVEHILYPKSLTHQLQKIVREELFNHLEGRYHTVLNNTMTIILTKKEELNSELDLRLHLHQPRARRIEMDIHNVRADELILHRDRVDRHCKGAIQALTDFQTDFNKLQDRQNKLTENVRTKIYNMEDTFNTATKSDKLVKLCNSLQSHLAEHMNVIQELQRKFRQNLEVKFQGLREANAQIMKSFKLFSEGGCFTPKEIEVYQKQLEKIGKRIDTADEALTLDMEGTESKCLEQAKEVINKFEERFHFLTVDLMFLENIQKVLTNTQVQIKAEVMKSNMQKKTINSMMGEMEKIQACTQLSTDKRDVSTEEINSLTDSLTEELRKRCQYLDCFMDSSRAVLLPDAPLQGAFAVAARPRSRKQEANVSSAGDSLLQPSRMGATFMNDAAVGVIKGLLRISKHQCSHDVSADVTDRSSAVAVPVRPSSPGGSAQQSARGYSQSGMETQRKKSAESISSQSVRRFYKPSRLDKRFHVFGSKPENKQNILTFKGFICDILWQANDTLLQIAEDFYKKKERRPVSRPQFIQKSFELCAEELNKRLLIYQNQTHEYHNNCVQEFCQQLKAAEGCLCQMPEVLLKKLSDQHLEDLSQEMTLIYQMFEHFQQQSEERKKEHSSQLRVRLSHPACEEELNKLTTAEKARQEEHTKAIHNTRLEFQACIKKNADEFVTSLAALTEKVLFQFDSMLTAEEIQCRLADTNQETITTLVRQKQAGTLQVEDKNKHLLERGSRTWPGIHYFGTIDETQRFTATITTAKTTMGHLKTVEIRNVLHKSYEEKIEEELNRVVKFSQEQETELLLWQEHWRNQLITLSTLNSE
ncbi:coiled-coil domain-containing protein 180-like isoform X3 [Hoplias malabaricus]|uniref:coiled-coil domain-containing protein 180-like isoform X3 n=1 Tax=Hoplias malabaricus TaxID=27720 RepID=UPI0034631B35